MISLGDFNINLLHKSSEELKTIISANSFTILNKIDANSFTRRDANSLSVIDHIHTDLNKQFILQLGESGISDHRYLLLIVKSSKVSILAEAQTRKYVNYDKVATCLNGKLSESFTSFDDFHRCLESLISQESKYKKNNKKSNYHKSLETKELKTLCEAKRLMNKLRFDFSMNPYFRDKYFEYKRLARCECMKA